MSEQMLSKSGYPLHENGWELEDNETMCYWKEEPTGIFHFIDITWLDMTREDPEYGTGREYVVCASEEGGEDFETALECFIDLHHTDPYCISDIVSREEAERIVMEYIKRAVI